jgi:hypothetical protein
MSDNLNALIEHKAVIAIASQIINGVQQEEEQKRAESLEEGKANEIQMQNLEGAGRSSETRPLSNLSKDQQRNE